MANRTPHIDASTDQLKSDLRNLSQTIEELVHATEDDTRSNVKDLRERAELRLKDTRARLEARGEKLYKDAYGSARHQADAFDEYVHDNPWRSLGIGTLVGIIVGFILGRR